MNEIDQDNDGSITLEEFLDGMARLEGALGLFNNQTPDTVVGKQEDDKSEEAIQRQIFQLKASSCEFAVF
jgi:Ca2+-binding EF-hand superfamily protein